METNFIKIRVFIPVTHNDVYIRNNDGSFLGVPDFIEKTTEADQKFREPIITFINDKIGLNNWAIKFIQADDSGTCFDVRIFCTSEIDAIEIIKIIIDKIKNLNFNWFYEGEISRYLQNN